MTQEDMTQLVETYSPMLLRAALTRLSTPADAEDAVQEVFLRLYTREEPFEGPDHLRRWLIRVTVNRAKDIRSSFWRRNRTDWREELDQLPFEEPAEPGKSAFENHTEGGMER